MKHLSSTQAVPAVSGIPRHVAIIMDGNGRWATQRRLPRVAGHNKGLEALRKLTEACAARGVGYLTVFAFSSENWRRPADEVSFLMRLFMIALDREVRRLDEAGIRLRVIGDLSAFDPKIQERVQRAEALTARHDRLVLTIAANYGGRWDVLQATRRLVADRLAQGGAFLPGDMAEEALDPYLSMHYAPEPDLFIRTGGEQRISNFLLWQLAYTEMYFTDTYWPDFDAAQLEHAIAWYQGRERRFGRTSAQVAGAT